MSEIQLKLPALDVSQIELARSRIKIARIADGWILTNRLDAVGDWTAHLDGLQMFINNYKAHWQIKIIINHLAKVKQMVFDFSAGSMDAYLDEHEKWADDESPTYDPYRALESEITTDGIDDLPPRLALFAELVFFLHTYQKRQDAMSEVFSELFGDNLKRHYLATDEEGNQIMVPEDAIPGAIVQDMRTGQEVREGLKNIEIEHCLDSYDEWLSAFTEMVKNRSSFAEMLPLFK